MTLGEKQELFAECSAKQILWFISKGYKVRRGDGPILPNRKMILDGATVKGIDAVHMQGGCHYMLIADDYNIFKDGKWLKTGNEPIWKEAAEHWESLHPLCRAGYRFRDPNHFSIEHNGKK